MRDDIVFALRRVRRSPGSSLFIVALLALVFALTASVFAVANGLLWAPLPYPEQARLVDMTLRSEKMDMSLGWSKPFYKRVQDNTTTLDAVAGYITKESAVADTSGRHLGIVKNVQAQPALFSMLHVAPLRGRTLLPDDAKEGAEPVAVVSEDFWRTQLGADPNVLARLIVIGDTRRRIVGVMPASFVFPDRDIQFWIPLAFSEEEVAEAKAGSFGSLRVFGRLMTGRSFADATAELQRLTRSTPSLKSIADSIDLQPKAEPARNIWSAGRAESMLRLVGAALLVFAVTQVNAHSLFFLRVVRRRKEFATLESVGAPPGRIHLQVVLEAMLLCSMGALAAALLLPAGLSMLRLVDILPENLPIRIGVDTFSVGALLVMAIITTLVFATAIIAIRHRDLSEDLRRQAQGEIGAGGRSLLRRVLVIGQIVLTLILLTVTGLLSRSAQKSLEEDVGYAREGRVVGAIKLVGRLDDMTEAQAQAHAAAWQLHVTSTPGVEYVALTSAAPLSKSAALQAYSTTGRHGGSQNPPPQAFQFYVGPQYFQAIGLQISRGRAFTPAEATTGAAVAIIDATIARDQFGTDDPIGKTLSTLDSRTDQLMRATIVGVAGLARQRSLIEPDGYPSVYFPDSTPIARAGMPSTTVEFIAHTSDPAGLQARVEAQARSGTSPIDVLWTQTIHERLEDSIADQLRLNLLLKILSAFALLLSGAGLYALLSGAVQARRGEFGIRMALGASPNNILASVFSDGLRTVLYGVLIAVPCVAWIGSWLAPRLHNVSAQDPVTLVGAFGIVLLIAIAANFLPAVRASQSDPAQALRSE